MLVALSKWTALTVLGGTFVLGSVAGWALRGGPADAPALAALPDGEPPIQGGVDLPPPVDRPRAAPAPTPPLVRATPTPGAWFRVGAGDTLSEMSQKAYGTAKRVGDILRANAGLDPRRIAKGTLVYVPVAAEPAPPIPR